MADHYKPSKAELEANMQASLAALEAQPPVPPAPSEAPQDTTPPEPSQPPVPPQDTSPAPSQVPEDVTPSQPPTEDKPVDYKKRYEDSSREARRLYEKNKEVALAINEAGQLQDPTDEEVAVEYPDYEELTPAEQKMARNDILNRKRFDLIQQATAKASNVDAWHEKVDKFVTDPKTLLANPDLEGYEDEFKDFASDPTRQTWDMANIILAFRGYQATNKTAPKKGQMFETGTGGIKEQEKPTDDRLTADQGRALMQTDYNKFKELLRAGKIKND